MKRIPLLYIQNKKVYTSQQTNSKKLLDLLPQLKNYEMIYIIDNDGIKNDMPNLSLHQKLTEHHEIWIDSGPRECGDVVDHLTSGAAKITIRTPLMKQYSLEYLRELTEIPIYTQHTIKEEQKTPITMSYAGEDGMVLFIEKQNQKPEFFINETLKQISKQHSIYFKETSYYPQSYLESIGIEGTLFELP